MDKVNIKGERTAVKSEGQWTLGHIQIRLTRISMCAQSIAIRSTSIIHRKKISSLEYSFRERTDWITKTTEELASKNIDLVKLSNQLHVVLSCLRARQSTAEVFLRSQIVYHEDGGGTFLRNVSYYKTHGVTSKNMAFFNVRQLNQFVSQDSPALWRIRIF
jgi:hypothetical protein